MRKPLHAAVALLAAAVLAGGLAACSAEERAAVAEYCAAHGDFCAALEQQDGANAHGGGQPVAITALPATGVPDELRAWAQAGSESPASVSLTLGDATYVAVAAGLRNTGGYRVEATGAEQRDNALVVRARVVAPPPGSMVTMVLTHPIGYFKLPAHTGDVRVELTSESGISATIANHEFWSANFRVVRPEQTSATEIRISGQARAFEAVFIAQVWAGDRKLAQTSVMTDAGAPEYGRFDVRLTAPGGVPAGATVRFCTESARDGSLTPELALPVAPQASP